MSDEMERLDDEVMYWLDDEVMYQSLCIDIRKDLTALEQRNESMSSD